MPMVERTSLKKVNDLLWEIPKSFDDIETLLAYVDVTDNISAKTVLFKFQVYCLPDESGCKVEGN